jgi:D-alanine-D-alanine ligase
LKIGIVFGGISWEHEISIVSSISLKDVINNQLVYIFLDKNREFYLIPTDKINSKLFSSGEYKKCKKLHITNGGFYQKGMFGDTKIEFDFMVNVVHGGDGEDGKLASMFEFFGIDFIGPRTEASVVSFNKFLTKAYAKELGVEVVDYQVLNKDDNRTVTFDYPVIIKPTRLGSSIGVSIVKSSDELDYALDVAFEFDNQVIIEPFINGVKEYNLAGCKANGEYLLSIVEEPQKKEFLDFEKKYLDFSRTSRVNEAEIVEDLTTKLQEAFKTLYNNTFEGALIRCDFFVIDGKVIINEINPIPGSMANYLFDDFNGAIKDLAKSLPNAKKINIDYKYIHSIQSAKGK